MMDTQTQAKRIGFLNAVFAGKSVSAGTVARVWAQGGGENARKTPQSADVFGFGWSGYKALTDSQPPGTVAQAAGRAPLAPIGSSGDDEVGSRLRERVAAAFGHAQAPEAVASPASPDG